MTLPATTGDPRHYPAPNSGDPHRFPVPNSGGLVLHAVARPVDAVSFAGRIAPGTRSVSLFLVNDRIASPDRERDEAFAFQAEIEVRSAVPFAPRPDPREVSGDDWDERVADLHYAHTPEYATGHGVSADWELVDGACRVLRTTWTPAAEVEKTETFDPPEAVLDMQALGALANGSAAETALSPLVTGYRSWIEERRAGPRRPGGRAPGDGRAALAPRRGRRGAHGARYPGTGRRCGCARRLPYREPRRGRRPLAASRPRRRLRISRAGGPSSSPSSC